MALMTAEQTAAELQRKKNAGQAPTSSANQVAYNKLTAQPMSAGAAGGAATGAIAGLPNGSIPQPSGPSLNGSIPSGGGGWMGVPKAINIAQATNPVSAAAAAGGANTNVNTVSAPPTKMSSTVYEPPASPVTAQPMSASVAQQPAPDYAALAAARTALALQQRTTIANQQKASADTAYNQQNLRTKDDRVLGDFRRTQTANPFGNMGRTSFQEGLVGRERTQADADASAALATQKGNIDALLADYQNATADEQIRIADELERADRSYKLDLAKFEQDQANYDKSFNYNSGQDAIKNGQTQQQIDYTQDPNSPSNIGQGLSNYGQTLTNSLNELKLGNYSEEQKQQSQLIEQQIKTGQMTQEAAEYNLKELKDPKSVSNQAKALELQMKKLDATNYPEEVRIRLQTAQKNLNQIGVVHYKPQTDAEKQYDLLQVDKIKADIEKVKSDTNVKNAKGVLVNVKDSSDAYDTVYQDIGDTLNLQEALDLVEQNAPYLTDSDYKSAKDDARKKFEVKKDPNNKYGQ